MQILSYAQCFQGRAFTLLTWLHLLVIDFFQARCAVTCAFCSITSTTGFPSQDDKCKVQMGGKGCKEEQHPGLALNFPLLHVWPCRYPVPLAHTPSLEESAGAGTSSDMS